MAIRILHLADLHLGSPFKGLGVKHGELPPRYARATLTAFENAVSVAVREQVDAVLVAGDVYEKRDRSLKARLVWAQQLERLHDAGVRTFVVHGNHDPLEATPTHLPSSVTVFGLQHHEVEARARDGSPYRVQGISYGQSAVTENLALHFSRRSDVPTLGLLHCNVGGHEGHSNYSPCTVDHLAAAGLDYWALGHVHTRATHTLPGGGVAAYPGNLQARNVFEVGARGGLLVELDARRDRAPQVRFVPCDDVRWHEVRVDIAGFDAEEPLFAEVERRLAALVDEAPSMGHVMRVVLEGEGPLHHRLVAPDFVDDAEASLRERAPTGAWLIEAVRVETATAIDVERIMEGGGLMAALAPYLRGEWAAEDAAKAIASVELQELQTALSRARVSLPSAPVLLKAAAAQALALLSEEP